MRVASSPLARNKAKTRAVHLQPLTDMTVDRSVPYAEDDVNARSQIDFGPCGCDAGCRYHAAVASIRPFREPVRSGVFFDPRVYSAGRVSPRIASLAENARPASE